MYQNKIQNQSRLIILNYVPKFRPSPYQIPEYLSITRSSENKIIQTLKLRLSIHRFNLKPKNKKNSEPRQHFRTQGKTTDIDCSLVFVYRVRVWFMSCVNVAFVRDSRSNSD